MQSLFRGWNFTFEGGTKKIAYESGLEGKPVVPIQALTASFLVVIGLAGTYLFLDGLYAAAFLVTAVAAQAWRFFSEMLRVDHRGTGRVSAYQVMGLFAMVYSVGVWLAVPASPAAPADVIAGLGCLWNPVMVIVLEALWLLNFLWFGRSKVTGSRLEFFVHPERI